MRAKFVAFVLAIALLAGAVLPAAAAPQGAATQSASAATAAATTAVTRPMDLADVLDWKSLRAPVLTDDGSWFAYLLQPTEGDSEVVVRAVGADTEHRFAAGELPMFGGSADLAFSADAQWFAYRRRANQVEAAKAKKAKKPATDTFVLVKLVDGTTEEIADIRGFAFADAGWVAVHKAVPQDRAKGDDPWTGTDLLLRRLADGATLTIGNVGEFGIDDAGRFLALAIDAADHAGNGLQVHDLVESRVLPLDSTEAVYSRPTWSDEGDALTVLRGRKDDAYEDKLFSVLGYTGFAAGALQRAEYDPHADTTFPAGMTINSADPAEWSDDRAALIFSVREAKAKDKPADAGNIEKGAPAEGGEGDPAQNAVKGEESPKPPSDDDLDTSDLVIWHTRDRRLQSQQQVQERRDRDSGYLAAYRVADKRFVQLADAAVPDATPAPKQRWAIGTDNAPYERMGSLEGKYLEDVYVIDMHTGDRRLAIEGARWVFNASPAGDRFLYFQDGNYHTWDMASGTSTNLTGALPVPFWNDEDDHNVVMPPRFQFGLGWSEDGASLLLTDGWDVWKLAADGHGAANVTVNGREQQIRYGSAYRLDPDADGIQLDVPVYLQAYGEWTKKGGVARLQPGATGVQMLRWDDAAFSGLMKAKDADVWLMTRETQADFPDWYVADADLRAGARLTAANPQQAEIAWSSGVQLVDYVSDKGAKLQGALFLPADYEPGKKYPTMVYIYERLSQGANRYTAPSANGFNKSLYTSNGYAVLMPDITYTMDDPGMSAVWCVLPALDAAIATGVVDPEAVGLHGHSWGGYQTSFLITQTDRFSAAIAGAPLTNMISMYALIYKNSGGGNGAIFEASQGRFTGGPWAVPDAYVRNSPVYHADAVTTPLILLHNDLDGAVDFTQGVEYYNTLRRLDKNVVMLEYVGENHGLRDPANRKDYTVRMREFFDHYLRDLGMPAWLQEGVPYLQLEDHRKERAKEIDEAVEAAREARKVKEEKPAGSGSGQR